MGKKGGLARGGLELANLVEYTRIYTKYICRIYTIYIKWLLKHAKLSNIPIGGRSWNKISEKLNGPYQSWKTHKTKYNLIKFNLLN